MGRKYKSKTKLRRDIKLLEKSIKHWEEMSKWALEKERCERISNRSISEMSEKIGQNWGGRYCSLCLEYILKKNKGCEKCPLGEDGAACNVTNSPWDLVNRSITWGEWFEHARQMLAVLKRARRNRMRALRRMEN